ncbi:hypothetical protein ASD24_04330 [Paenibacillus sp. Root52]|uniref:Uncharacterized protein n=1 Tax=Paenibacillus amylolyticus TaxID=1451 RepID=A0AAP5H5H2_PAEAM|nr:MULTISPECIES: hypothetical protein [Paenibacillus]KQY94776.1 hypothetical protein ASD24_04330 [Paenibacillus sp. Root52]MDR6726237.1 hypothetical protein [Paenibacillus amylolyticus]
MDETIDQLQYDEKHYCWEGTIEVQASKDLFQTDLYTLNTFIDEAEQPLCITALNSIDYVKEHFEEIYHIFLESMLAWQNSNKMAYEVYDEETHNFDPIHFSHKEEIHNYLGSPLLQIHPSYIKDQFSYYSVNFFNQNRLSIEHGFSALFHKKELIDLIPFDAETGLQNLIDLEPDCTRWQPNFWMLKLERSELLYNDPPTFKNVWLNGTST